MKKLNPGFKRFLIREALPSTSVGILSAAVVVLALRGGVGCKTPPPSTATDVKNVATCFLKDATAEQAIFDCAGQEIAVAFDVIRMLAKRHDGGADARVGD